MNDKRKAEEHSTDSYKVMLSSTTKDLPEHRETAKEAILRAKCTPIMMEHGTAKSHSDAISFSLCKVEESEIYLGIFCERYGFIPQDLKRNPDELSITELEYRHAKSLNKRILIFLAHETHLFQVSQIEYDENPRQKLKKLTDELKIKETVAFFKNHENLATLIVQALGEEKDNLNSPKAQAAAEKAKHSILEPPRLWSVPNYTLTNKFIGRTPELARLDEWAMSGNSVLVVEGIGGLGKSALTWEWVNQYAHYAMPNLYGRLWWSFYEQTSLEEFTRYALAYLLKQDPAEIGCDYAQNVRQLIVELNARPSLLVLDGFERVLMAYHRWDKAQQRDDKIASHLRGCTNPADADLLKWLTGVKPSKVLITSRLFPQPLENSANQEPVPSVEHFSLDGLSDSDVLAFISYSGISGNKMEMLRFSAKFGCHSLVLKVICGMVNRYRKAPGSFDVWLSDPEHGGSLKLQDVDLTQRKNHILAFAMSDLDMKTRKILCSVSLLSEDVDYNTISKINPYVPQKLAEPVHIKDSIRWNYLWDTEQKNKMLSEYQQQYKTEMHSYKIYKSELKESAPNFDRALEELEELGLLQWDRDNNRYNMHPVVRGYASEEIESTDKQYVFKTARDHFAAMPEDDLDNATELYQINTSLNIYYCLLGEGSFDEAFKFYRDKLSRVVDNRWFAFALQAELIAPLLQEQLKGHPIFEKTIDQIWVSERLAQAYHQMGRSEHAMEMIKSTLKLCIDERDWLKVSNCLATLSNIYVSKNCVAESTATIRLRRIVSDVVGDKSELENTKLFQGGEAIRRGKFTEGDAFLSEIENPTSNVVFWKWVSKLFQEKATDENWLEGYEFALEREDLLDQHYFLTEYGAWQMELDKPEKALEAIDQALHLANKMGRSAPKSHGVRAWTLASLGRKIDAENELNMLGEKEQLYYAAKTWSSLGMREKAIECGLLAYEKAWGIGSPYTDRHTLKKIKLFLKQECVKLPEFPPFDSSKVEAIPFEKEIREGIKKYKLQKQKAE